MTRLKVAADEIVQQKLDEMLDDVSEAFDGDVFCWNGPVAFGVDTVIRRIIEQRKAEDSNDHLVVILTTEGGIVEVVQRVVETIRRHYSTVSFVIPDYAYSAGTVFAMSGDAIYMDYYSRLGPIDPQIERGDRLVPALGYCEQYNTLIKKSTKEKLTDAEIAVLIGAFDQAELYEFEQARQLSISLVTEWLVKYKFKDWNATETRGAPVSLTMKKRRARRIASELSKTDRWHSHGAGIPAQLLREQMKLKINDLDAEEEKKNAVEHYHYLLEDYQSKLGMSGTIHVRGNFAPYHVHRGR